MSNIHTWNPSTPTILVDGDEMSMRGQNVRVDWTDLDEGYCGDYNADDPEDEVLLRFDGYYWDGAEWREVEDFSYCTRVPVSTPVTTKAWILAVIHARLLDALSGTVPPCVSVKKLGEELSWICPEDAPDTSAMTLPPMKAVVRPDWGYELLVDYGFAVRAGDEDENRLIAALLDVTGSKVEAVDASPCERESLAALARMQERAREAKAESGIDIQVSMDLALTGFDVSVNGSETLSSLSTEEAAESLIAALAVGAAHARKLCVETQAGAIIAEALTDPGAPGIALELQPKGGSGVVDMALAECHESPELRKDGESEDDVLLYVWSQPFAEEWQDKISFTGEMARLTEDA